MIIPPLPFGPSHQLRLQQVLCTNEERLALIRAWFFRPPKAAAPPEWTALLEQLEDQYPDVLLLEFERGRRPAGEESENRGWAAMQIERGLRDQICFGGIRIPGISAQMAQAGRADPPTLKRDASPETGRKSSRRLKGQPAAKTPLCGPARGALVALAVSIVNRFCTVFWYGRAGRLTVVSGLSGE
jgi:hypothetical protein